MARSVRLPAAQTDLFREEEGWPSLRACFLHKPTPGSFKEGDTEATRSRLTPGWAEFQQLLSVLRYGDFYKTKHVSYVVRGESITGSA